MSKKEFFLNLRQVGLRNGYQPLSDPPAPKASSAGFLAVEGICHFKIFATQQNIRLEIRFGFGRHNDLEANRIPFQRFQTLVNQKHNNAAECSGTGPKEQNYFVRCGARDVDYSSRSSIETVSNWLVDLMNDWSPLIHECFGVTDRGK